MIPSIFDYLPEHADQLMKFAEKKKEESPTSRKAKIIGKGMLGFGLGTGLGIGGTALADHLYERAKGQKIPQSTLLRVLPYATGGLGMAYGIHKALEQEELNRVQQD